MLWFTLILLKAQLKSGYVIPALEVINVHWKKSLMNKYT